MIPSRRMGGGLAVAVVLGSWFAGESALGAGRIPYGGRVEVAVDDLAGVRSPHGVRAEDGRLVASLVHSGLFRGGDGDAPRPELAAGPGVVDGTDLVLRLRPGARFHDGTTLTSRDVVQSVEAIRRLRQRGPLWPLTRQLDATRVDAQTVRIPIPRGGSVEALRWLLGRPELAILRGGRAGQGRGCGPFRPTTREGSRQVLEAFEGHARGRPWIAEVVLEEGVSVDGEVERMIFGRLAVAFATSPQLHDQPRWSRTQPATVVAVPAGRWRGEASVALRLAVAARARELRLDLQIDARVRPAPAIWPKAVWPGAPALPGVAGTLTPVPSLTIAYPAGDPTLRDVAFGVRDSMRWLVRSEPRAVAVPGLDGEAARSPAGGRWDLAIIRHVWAGRSRAEVAMEAAWLAGAAPPSSRALWRGALKGFAHGLTASAGIIPLLHARLDVHHRPDLRLAPGASAPVDLSASYRLRR